MQQKPPLVWPGCAGTPYSPLFLQRECYHPVNLKIPNVVVDWSELVYTGVKTLDFFYFGLTDRCSNMNNCFPCRPFFYYSVYVLVDGGDMPPFSYYSL